MTSVHPTQSPLSGRDLRDAFAATAASLGRDAPAIDAINVYPVPDGDTGTNMASTLREAADAAMLTGDDPPVAAVLEALARGALFGARGNSGVILSQALRGLAEGIGSRETLDAAGLDAGLRAAAAAAYGAVGKPVEGTMLTVLRVAGEASARAVQELPGGGENVPCLPVLRGALDAATVAEAATQEQLPSLREAGVPDAGGEGVCAILRGLLGALMGTAVPPAPMPERAIGAAPGHASEALGFCTEFIVQAGERPIDVDLVRGGVAAGRASSVVVVGDTKALRVHVHTPEPEPLLELAATWGALSRVKVEDMSAQNKRFRSDGSGAGARLALLALSRGPGIDAVFEGLGAHVMVLDYAAKPAAGEIAAAADALRSPDVVVLPNHKDVLLAAQQAAALTRCTLHVVPSTSLPQGIAAALAFAPGEPPAENVARMEAALPAVRTVEVTTAAAARTVDGVTVQVGDAIALVDGRLVAALAAPAAALVAGLTTAGAGGAGLITVFTGLGVPWGAVQAEVALAFPGAALEWVDGGQPLYQFIASVE